MSRLNRLLLQGLWPVALVTGLVAVSRPANSRMLLPDPWLDRITAGGFAPPGMIVPMTRSWLLSFVTVLAPGTTVALPPGSGVSVSTPNPVTPTAATSTVISLGRAGTISLGVSMPQSDGRGL